MDYNPNDVYIKIKKLEFKFLLLPLILILINFVLVWHYKIVEIKYVSLLLLIIYFFIKLMFRINRIDVAINTDSVKSPVTGIVKSIENNTIVVKKGIFDKADLRYSNAGFILEKGKSYIFSQDKKQSILIGVIPGNCLCKIILPQDYKITVKPNQKVIAGVTDLGSLNEKH